MHFQCQQSSASSEEDWMDVADLGGRHGRGRGRTSSRGRSPERGGSIQSSTSVGRGSAGRGRGGMLPMFVLREQ